jgi:8-oxo-dGTP pyrophosphatase MutT (NUDIX family)
VPGVQALIDQATLHERSLLQTRSFSELWRILWNGPATKRYQTDYDQSKAKFDSISGSGLMRALCLSSATAWMEPEWGFPKGRRAKGESDLDCAIREFNEETNILPEAYEVCKNLKFVESFSGTNGIKYMHIYYVAKLVSSTSINLSQRFTSMQQKEISGIAWKTLSQAKAITRSHYVERKELINTIEKTIETLVEK